MNKKIKKLFYLKGYLVILNLFIIIISLTYLIYFNKWGSPLSYVLYLIMTYSLIVVCIKIYEIIKAKINNIINHNKYLKKYVTDHKTRHKISLYTSLLFNIVYAVFKLISGIIFKSVWFISLLYIIYY